MKAKVLMLTLLGACAISFGANAQQDAPKTQNLSGHKTVFNNDGAGDHWFIDVEGGAVMLPFGEANNKAEFMNRVSLGMPMLGIGKWHNPWFGSRVQLYGWRAYGYEFKNPAKELNKYGNFFAGANYQFMFDVVNYFAHYNSKRVFHLVPYVGVGASYLIQVTEGDKFSPALPTKGKANYVDPATAAGVTNTADLKKLQDENNKLSFLDPLGVNVNAGVLFKFRLGRRVDLNLDAQMIATKINMRGTDPSGINADVMALLTAGLSFNLGKPEWTEVVPMDWALVNDLNAQINSLRAENAELSKRPVSCPECPEVVAPAVEQTKNIYYSSVFFRLNSAKIDRDQKVNIEQTAAFAKESGEKIYLTGYADAKTGSAEYNMNISERRVKAVADMLINEYGVPADQVVTSFKGSDVQPFEKNSMNRVVIATGHQAE